MRAVACATVVIVMMGVSGIAGAQVNRGAQADHIERAKRAVAARPNDPALWVTLAELLADYRPAEAIDAYQAAIKLDANAALPKLALARVYLLRASEPVKATLLLRDVIATSTDDALVLRAWNDAIGVEEMLGTLDELAQILLPQAGDAFRRRLLVLTYDREVSQLEIRVRRRDAEAAAASAQLARIGKLALAPLVAALDDPEPVMQRAITVLGGTGNPAAAPPLAKLAAKAMKITGPVARPLSDERALQVAALVAVGRLASPAVFDAVLPMMKHPEVPIREAATFAIGRIADRRAIAPLLAALDDKAASIATLSCLGLVRQRDSRVGPALVAVVGNRLRHPWVRAACAYAIGVHRIPAGVPALTAALEDAGDVGRIAAWSLGELATPAALGSLLAAYFTNAGRDRRELEFAIARTSGAPAAVTAPPDLADYPRKYEAYDPAQMVAKLPGEVPALAIPDAMLSVHAQDIGRCIASGLGSPEASVMLVLLAELDDEADRLGFGVLTPKVLDASAATAIASIGSAIEPALTALLAHYDSRIRARTLSVLVKAVGPRAEVAIAATLSDPAPSVRAAAMAAIGQLARRHPVPPALAARLVRELGSTSWPDRAAAARAMGNLGGAADTSALAVAARDDSIFVREAVATALGAIGTPATVEPLLGLSRDDVPAVRAAAAKALRPINDPRARQRVNEMLADPELDSKR